MTAIDVPSVDSLTPTERREFIRIVKGRFKVLRMQVKTEARRVLDAERQRVMNTHRKELTTLTRKAERLNARQKALADDCHALRQEIRDSGFNYPDSSFDTTIFPMNDLLVPTKFNPSGHLRGVHSWWREDEQSVIANMLAVLAKQEQDALEPLIIGKLASPSAKAFLASLPTIDTFTSAWRPDGVIEATPNRELAAA